jgi:hypothetical protein
MGVDLVPELLKDSFAVVEGKFVAVGNADPTDPEQIAEYSVENGCITPGLHRVFRFTIHTTNKGTEDLVIGAPKDRLDIFAHPRDLTPPLPDAPYEWIMKEKFFTFSLENNSGTEYSGYKRPFCFAGGLNHQTNPPSQFSCLYQGIGVSGFDSYNAYLPCQFIIIDGLKDGIYTFKATVNAPSVDAVKNSKGNVMFEEDNYDNNTVSLNVKFNGNNRPVVV